MLLKWLQSNPYPGRGIVLGIAPSGNFAIAAYFIMGRSGNSRNRVFVQTPEGGIATAPADPAQLQDPSLVIYNAVRRFGAHLVVTNGDQTDTVYNALQQGFSFGDGLRTRTFEPDEPNYTPRISGLLSVQNGGFTYQLSILKSAGGNAASVQRQFFEYPQPLAGKGHFIHTYQTNGNPLPSFMGEPVQVDIPEDATVFGQNLWNALNEENKISLLLRCLFTDGSEQTTIFNKYNQI